MKRVVASYSAKSLAATGGVIDFKRAFLNSLGFDELLAQSKGQERTRLYLDLRM
jgi:hypothetical protein